MHILTNRSYLSKFFALLIATVFICLQTLPTMAITKNDLQSIREYTSFYGECEGAATGTTTVNLVGNDNIQKGFNYFLGKGLTQYQTAGIIGNFMVESSMVPDRNQVGGGPGRGIAQWSVDGRWANLLKFAAKNGGEPTSLALQLDFVWAELNGTAPAGDYSKVLNDLKTIGLPDENDKTDAEKEAAKKGAVEKATNVFMLEYEAPGIPHLDKRIAFANAALKLYGGSDVNGGDATTDGAQEIEDTTTSNGCPGGVSTGGVSVMTWNVLSTNNGTEANVPGTAANPSGGRAITSDQRLGFQKEVIEAKNPDIIAIQELSQPEQKKFYNDNLSTYDSTLSKSPNKKESQDGGRTIFWKKNLFKEVDRGYYYACHTGCGKASNNRMVWTKLQDKASSKMLYVFTTHENQNFASGNEYDTAKSSIDKTVNAITAAVGSSDAPVIYAGHTQGGFGDHSVGKGDLAVFNALSGLGFKHTFAEAPKDQRLNEDCETTHNNLVSQDCGKKSPRYIDSIYIKGGTVKSWENIARFPKGTKANDSLTTKASDANPVIASLTIPGIAASAEENAGTTTSDDTNPDTTGTWGWPVKKADYKPLSNCYQKPGHTGIDIPVGEGTPVYAARAGKVVAADANGGTDGGKYVIIKHGDTLYSNYQHNSALKVKVGEEVKAGQQIAVSGDTGFTKGAHVHFSITTQNGLDSRAKVEYSVNPLKYLPSDRSLGQCK